MQPPEIPITAEGLAEVKRELDDLVTKRRPEIVGKIKAARAEAARQVAMATRDTLEAAKG